MRRRAARNGTNFILPTKQTSLKTVTTSRNPSGDNSSNLHSKEFPELSPEAEEKESDTSKFPWIPSGKTAVVLEIGCGVGNTLCPLMELNPMKYFIGFDCSQHAIENFKVTLLLHNSYLMEQKRERYNEDQCKVFVLDITREAIPDTIPENSVDIALLVFVLSAISPQYFESVLKQIFKVRWKGSFTHLKVLKPGGILFFRDYGKYDMTQMRFSAKKRPNKMGEDYYVRGDGTLTYFFEKGKTALWRILIPSRTNQIAL